MQDHPKEQHRDCPDTDARKDTGCPDTMDGWKIVMLEPWQGGGIMVPGYFTPEQIAEAVRREDEERRADR